MTGQNTSPAGKPANIPLQYPLNSLHRILVVEDDRNLRRINAMLLYHAGYHVDTAEDGASGWSALQASRYDVLITDNNMPGMTGLELIKKARFKKMPLSVILASGAAPTEELDRYPWLLDAMLLKPYTAEAMLETVKNVLPQANDPAAGAQMSGSHDLKNNKISQAGKPTGAPVPCQPNPPRRILVVEDEPDIRRLNAEVLKNSGYHVDTAEDGILGWKALHAVRHAPDSYALLITDHEMPGMTGLALVKRLRAARMALPVIMATGTLPAEDLMNRYSWLQPATALVKPYSVEQLLGTVEKVLRATAGSGDEFAPPNWLKPPPDDDLRL